MAKSRAASPERMREALFAMLEVEDGYFSFEQLSESETESLVSDPELHLPSVTLRMAKLRDDLDRMDTRLRVAAANGQCERERCCDQSTHGATPA